MSYIGIQDQKASQVRRFSVTGSTSATHLLTWVAANEQSLIVTINGVKQHDDAYTIAGNPTTVTLSSALVSTDKLEVIGIADVGQEITPADNSVGTLKLADDAVTNAKLGDNAVTNAKLVDIMFALYSLYMLLLFIQNIGNNFNRRLHCKVI